MTKEKKKRPKKKGRAFPIFKVILALILATQTKSTSRQTITESPLARAELLRRITSSNNTKTKITTLRIIMMQMIIMMAIKIIIKKMDTRRMKIISQGATRIMRVKMDTKMERVETVMWKTVVDRKRRRLTLAMAKMENDY